MRLVILPLVAALAAAALSGCIDMHEDCSGDGTDHRSDGSYDASYEYEYEYDYDYDYDQGGSAQGHGSSHGSSHGSHGSTHGGHASGHTSGSYDSYAYVDASDEHDEESGTSCHTEEERTYEHEDVEETSYEAPTRVDHEPHFEPLLAPTIDPLYSGAWSGSGDIDDGFAVEGPYDFVLTHLIHQGQALGDGFRYTDPEEGEMDHACLIASAGQTIMTRSLPPSQGQAAFRFDGRIGGHTTLDAWGYRGHTPPTLLHVLHQGERADSPVPLGTRMDFYVPEGIGEMTISLLHQGQALLGARLYDADGQEVAKLASSSGQEAHTTTTDGQAGIWSLELDGIRAGQFQVAIHPSGTEATPELPAP